MQVVELTPDQLPLLIRFRVGDETKEYVLLKTKQGKLLLNKFDGEYRKNNT